MNSYYYVKKKDEKVFTYLENAQENMFVSLSNRINVKTTSHGERLMRTMNMRNNVGKWNPQGALNVTKVRLAYYYNGFNALRINCLHYTFMNFFIEDR